MKKVISIILICVLFLSVFPVGSYAAATASDFTFELNSNKTGYVLKKYNGKSTRVVIPETYNGLPVTEIGSSIFVFNDYVKTLDIPSSVTKINSYAFANCTALKSLTVPDSVKETGSAYLYNCKSLEELTVPFLGLKKEQDDTSSYNMGMIFGYLDPESNNVMPAFITQKRINYETNEVKLCESLFTPTLKKVTVTGGKIPFGAFSDCNSIEKIILEKGVKKIEESAFEGCTALTEMIIPDTVTAIGRRAFYRCLSLADVVISANVKKIEDETFFNCTNLRSIDLPIGIESFGSCALEGTEYYNNKNNRADGVLYLNRCLIEADSSVTGDFSAKANTETIADDAFYGNTGITSVTLSPITSNIGKRAFYGCSELSEVKNISGVKSIDEKAFLGCIRLKSDLSLPFAENIGDEAFSGCSNITDLSLDNTIKKIGNKAFYNCESLNNITIPDCTVNIGASAFSGTEYIYDKSNSQNGIVYIGNHLLKSNNVYGNVSLKDSTITMADNAFYYESDISQITFPDSLQLIGNNAFRSCTGLTSVTIPDSVKYIGDGAFWNCTSLASVSVPFTGKERNPADFEDGTFGLIFGKSVSNDNGYNRYTVPESIKTITVTNAEVIPERAFFYLKTVKKINIKSGAVKICDYAFSHCQSLTEVTLPNGVKYIGEDAFYHCDNLSALTLPDTVATFGDRVFCLCISLSKINIPKSVKELPDALFSSCESLKSINIPEGVTKIGSNTFGSCTGLTAVTLPSTLETLGFSAFFDCKSLKSINLKNVKTINDWAFWYCCSLTEITIPNTVTEIGKNAFNGCTSLEKIFIPKSVKAIGTNAIPSNVPRLIIGGYKNSAAEKYASRNKISFLDMDKFTEPVFTEINNTGNGLNLVWSKSPASKGYKVYRKIEGTESFTMIFGTSSASVTSFLDKTAKAGTSYRYAVKAVNGKFETATYITANTHTRLLQPALKSAEPAGGVVITWSKVSGAENYYVYRKINGEKTWTRIASVNSTAYTDTSAKSGKTYIYTVKAINKKSSSTYNKTGIKIYYLARPKVNVKNTSNGVNVSWNKIGGAKGYYVYRKTSTGDWTRIANIKSGSTVSYTDTAAKSGTKYYYCAKAYNGTVKGGHISSSAVIYLKAVALSSVTSTKTGVTVKWGKISGANGYYVYRKTSAGDWTRIANIKSGKTVKYLDKSAKKGTTYTYCVKAYNGSFSSACANSIKCKSKF